MRVKITKPGIFGANGEIPVGTIAMVASEPIGWAGRYEIVDGAEHASEKVEITNPVSGLEALALVDGNFMAFKSAAKKVLGDATPDKKDEIVAALINALSDTDLKTYLGAKGVQVADETREQLVELAKAA